MRAGTCEDVAAPGTALLYQKRREAKSGRIH